MKQPISTTPKRVLMKKKHSSEAKSRKIKENQDKNQNYKQRKGGGKREEGGGGIINHNQNTQVKIHISTLEGTACFMSVNFITLCRGTLFHETNCSVEENLSKLLKNPAGEYAPYRSGTRGQHLPCLLAFSPGVNYCRTISFYCKWMSYMLSSTASLYSAFWWFFFFRRNVYYLYFILQQL